MQIDQMLGAKSASLLTILGERNRGFYIPLYQRQYRWTFGMIGRLLQDVMSGIDRLLHDDETVNFVGTLITSVKDPTEDLGHEPGTTLAIIDGQQRVTTLSLMLIACHDEIRVRTAKLDADTTDSEAFWLQTQLDRAREDMFDCLVDDTKSRAHPHLRYRPRVIRAVDDRWGTRQSDARYESPLPVITMDYVAWQAEDGEQPFVFSPADHSNGSHDYGTFLVRFRDDIRRHIRKALTDESEDFKYPEWEDLAGSMSWRELFESDAPDIELAQQLIARCQTDIDFAAMTRLLVLSRFILDRVVFTLVRAQREDYALDMFDSLNTTGEPLTAIETFKPRVIHGEGGVREFRNSPSKRHFDEIEDYLKRERRKDEADIAKRIVGTFALSETGEKIGNKLSEQRNYLRETYLEAGANVSRRRAMTRQLERVSAFDLRVWTKLPDVADGRLVGELKLTDEAVFHLDVLQQTQHTICQALLSRYFDRMLRTGLAEHRVEFERVTRAVLGFWILWRSSTDGTRSIDSVHRELMAQGLQVDGTSSLPPIARMYENDLPSASDIGSVLRATLVERRRIASRDDYVAQAFGAPIGKTQKLARFVVLAASHHRVPDPINPGFTKQGRPSPDLEMLSLASWRSPHYSTVEHVAPQTMREGEDHDQSLYIGDRIHMLGNLTVLPVDVNTSLSNRSWQSKREIYRALTSNSPDEARAILEQTGYEYSDNTVDLVADNAHAIPPLRPLLGVDQWSYELVSQRTKSMLGSVWDAVDTWIS